MVRIKQKPAPPALDWTGVDSEIERLAYPQLAERLPAIAGTNEGVLIAPGINRIYARIGGDTEATIIMYSAGQAVDTLQLNAPIEVYWNKKENSYVFDGLDVGAYNQASGGTPPQTATYLASYIVQVPNNALPNAQDLDSLSNGMLNKTTGGVVSSLAPSTSGNIAQSNGTAWTSTAPSFNASVITAGILPVANGGTGAATLTSNNLLVGNGTGAVTFIAPSTAGRMLRSNGTVWNPYLNNIAATAAPTTGDDSNDGYAVGSYWLDLTNDHIYIAIDVTVGAAVWLQVDGSSVDWANPGTIGSTTPNTGAFTTLTATTGQFDPNSNNRTEILAGGVQETRAESSNLTQPVYHIMRRAGGTIASPSATQNTQVIARWEADSHSGSAYVTAGYLQFDATETHSVSVRGTKATLRTTQAGGTTTRDHVLQDYGAYNPPALSSDPSSPVAGDQWRNTASKRNKTRLMGINEHNILAGYTQVGDRQITNTVSADELNTTTFTIPAGEAVVGMIFVFEAWGYFSVSGTASRNWSLVTDGAVTLWSTSFTLATASLMWSMRLWVGINTIGSSGNVWAQGFLTIPTTTRGTANTAVSSAINFNNAVSIDATFTPASISDDMHCNGFTVTRY